MSPTTKTAVAREGQPSPLYDHRLRRRGASPFVSYLLTFVVLLACLLTSLSGLLSKRDVLTDVTPLPLAGGPKEGPISPASASSSPPSSPSSSSFPPPSALSPPIVDQVVLVIVDALRPDFVFPILEPFIREGDHECAREDLLTEGRERPTTRPFLKSLNALARGGGGGVSGEKDGNGGAIDANAAAVTTFLIADAPTTTSQRLKAIMTGTIPAFIEGGANFNSDEVIEDSLLLQLRQRRRALRSDGGGTGVNGVAFSSPSEEPAAKKDEGSGTNDGAAVVLGDDTWLALFGESYWREHVVFPSFDVRDLDSNDAGVAAHMARVLRGELRAEEDKKAREGPAESGEKGSSRSLSASLPSPSSSHSQSLPVEDMRGDGEVAEEDAEVSQHQQSPSSPIPTPHHPPLVVMHLLGLDHAGHSFSAYHPEMERKLVDVDRQLTTLINLLEARAAGGEGSDGAPATTALIVMGDHGMTNSGDHGGDFSQETDTMAITRIFRKRAGEETSRSKAPQRASSSAEEKQRPSLAESFVNMRWAACASDKSHRRDQHAACRFHRCARTVADHSKLGGAPLSETGIRGGKGREENDVVNAPSALSLCSLGAAYQIDIVPTLAALLGLGVPFSNMGSVIPEVIALAASSSSAPRALTSATAAEHVVNATTAEAAVLTAVRRNYQQIHAYLAAEAGAGGGGSSPTASDSSSSPTTATAASGLDEKRGDAASDAAVGSAETSIGGLELRAAYASLLAADGGTNSKYAYNSHTVAPPPEGFSGDAPMALLTLNYLRSLGATAAAVRRSRAQMKVDRIFVGAVCGLLWCAAVLAFLFRRAWAALHRPSSEPKQQQQQNKTLAAAMDSSNVLSSSTMCCKASSRPLVVAAVCLAAIAFGIAFDASFLVLGGCVTSVVAGIVGIVLRREGRRRGQRQSLVSGLGSFLFLSRRGAGPLMATLLLVVVRVVPPFSNSFVVFEDTIVQWLLCLAAALACFCTPPLRDAEEEASPARGQGHAKKDVGNGVVTRRRQRAFAPAHLAAFAMCGLCRLLGMAGARSRRHHTHTVDAQSALDGHLMASWGWDGNLKGAAGGPDAAVGGSTIFDLFVLHSASTAEGGLQQQWRLNHFAAGQLTIRFALNLLCVAGLLFSPLVFSSSIKGQRGGRKQLNTTKAKSSRGKGTGLGLSLMIAAVMTLAEHVPYAHHSVGVGGALLLLALAFLRRHKSSRIASASSPVSLRGGSSLITPMALFSVWASTLSTTPSARLAAACGPLVVRLGAAVVGPLRGASAAPIPSSSSVGRDGGVSTINSHGYHLPQPLPPLLFHLLGWSLFFASGQQTVISTLDWGSAFVGVQSFHIVRCGALVVVRTFWPFLLSILVPSLLLSEDEVSDAEEGDGAYGATATVDRTIGVAVGADAAPKVDFSLFPSPSLSHPHSLPVAELLAGLLLFQSLEVAASCLAAGILRMHLMMWAIFCPKLLYDAIIWALVSATVLVLGGARAYFGGRDGPDVRKEWRPWGRRCDASPRGVRCEGKIQ